LFIDRQMDKQTTVSARCPVRWLLAAWLSQSFW